MYKLRDQGNYPLIIDLSHHNTVALETLDAKNKPIGIIHKATEGESFVDRLRAERGGFCWSLGIPFATYHFLRAGNPIKQMEHYINTIRAVPGELLCIDHEPSLHGSEPSLQDLITATQYLKDKGYRVAIYSGHLIKSQLGTDRYSELDDTDLWIAHYTKKSMPTWPTQQWEKPKLWQWTDQGALDGVLANTIDMNRFFGTHVEAAAWMWGNRIAPTIPDEDPIVPEIPTPTMEININLSIDVPPGVKLNVNVNEPKP